MALVDFEINFKATCQDLVSYSAVKARIDGMDLASIGQNVVKTTNPDDDPNNLIISVKVTGENTPPGS